MLSQIKKFTLKTIIILIASFIIGLLSWKFLGNDNVAEEAAEKAIENITGLEIDFSPDN